MEGGKYLENIAVDLLTVGTESLRASVALEVITQRIYLNRIIRKLFLDPRKIIDLPGIQQPQQNKCESGNVAKNSAL